MASEASSTTKPPVFKSPLIIEPTQDQVMLNLGNLAPLVGTWVNLNPNSGYNLMPLPQEFDSTGQPWGPKYILKNTPYFEELTFSAINGNAANRGGQGTQVCNTLLYEQRVYFTSGPDTNSLLHIENGTWMNFTARNQFFGPYGTTPMPGSSPPVLKFEIGKQMSVPHGNSILAVGQSIKNTSGDNPDIPTTPEVIPSGIDGTQYGVQSVGNPNVELTNNPNKVLMDNSLTSDNISEFITLEVDSTPVPAPTNIAFENAHAKVTSYKQIVWLLASQPGVFNRLQYTQTIGLELTINGVKVNFPHVTANTLVRKTF